jgi:ABC-type Fe3+/spermidine/putrescine transport system ATPase subunit
MIDVAIFGAGRIGKIHAGNLVRQPGVRLKLVVDPDAAAAAALAARHGATVAATEAVVADPAVLAVRPHRLRVVPGGQGLIEGVCRRVAYLGSRAEYTVATPWGDLLAFDGNARTRVAREAPVGIRFDPDAVIVLPR